MAIGTHRRRPVAVAALALSLSLTTSALAQTTLFTTKDYRQDRDRWTDPAYYVYNTARELTDMQVDNRFGQKGAGADQYDIKSPYPFRSSSQHYDAWLKKANGGTKHTLATLPNWDGVWSIRATWLGESIGFWDGAALVIHTNQIRQWNATHSLFEWSDQLTAVERYERVGNEIVGEITLYDPVAFLAPLHARLRFTPNTNDRMVYSTCTDTNGPSSNIHVRPDGVTDERVQGDPGYWDPNDPRPWAAHYAIGERQTQR